MTLQSPAAPPRAARRPEVLHVVPPHPGPPAGGDARPRRGRRGRAGPRPRPGPRGGRRVAVERRRLHRDLRAARQLAAHRLFPDAEVRRLQLRGQRPALALFQPPLAPGARSGQRRRRHASPARARGREADEVARADRQRRAPPSARTPTSTTWTTWATARGVTASGAGCASALLSTGRQRAVAMVVAALVVVLGHPGALLRDPAPRGPVGAPASWSRAGTTSSRVGSRPAWGPPPRPRPPSGSSGSTGTVLFGAMGMLQKVLLLGCIPLGAWGVSRFMRPLVSPRARVVAVDLLPRPAAALRGVGTGRWDGLVAYAALPLHRAAPGPGGRHGPLRGRRAAGWRAGRSDRSPCSAPSSPSPAPFAPALVPMALSAAVALALGSAAGRGAGAGRARPRRRRRGRRGGRCVVRSLGGGDRAGRQGRRGDLRSAHLPATAPGWGEVLRFAIGPGGPLSLGGAWLPPRPCRSCWAAGLRLVWAARLWVMALRVVGPRLRRHPGRPGQLHAVGVRRVGARPRSPSPPASVWGSRRSKMTWSGVSSAGARSSAWARSSSWPLGLLPVVGGAANGRWGLPSRGSSSRWRSWPGRRRRASPGCCGWATRVRCRWAGGRCARAWPTP